MQCHRDTKDKLGNGRAHIMKLLVKEWEERGRDGDGISKLVPSASFSFSATERFSKACLVW